MTKATNEIREKSINDINDIINHIKIMETIKAAGKKFDTDCAEAITKEMDVRLKDKEYVVNMDEDAIESYKEAITFYQSYFSERVDTDELIREYVEQNTIDFQYNLADREAAGHFQLLITVGPATSLNFFPNEDDLLTPYKIVYSNMDGKGNVCKIDIEQDMEPLHFESLTKLLGEYAISNETLETVQNNAIVERTGRGI